MVAEHRYRSARCAAHLPPGPSCMRTTLPDLLPGVLDSCPSFWPVVPTEDLGRDRPERRDAHWLIVTTSDSPVGVHVQASLPGLQDHQQLLFKTYKPVFRHVHKHIVFDGKKNCVLVTQ